MKAWIVINRSSIIWTSDQSDQIKCSSVNAIVWMHHIDTNKTHVQKTRWELHKNASYSFERFLEATCHKIAAVWPLTSNLKNIQVRRTRHVVLRWRNKDELISDVLGPLYSVGRPTDTYLHQLCTETGCSFEYPLGAKDDRVRWKEKEKEKERER